MQTAKDQVREVLDRLPDDASLSDIRYQLNDALYALAIQQQIERGMEDSRAGRVTPHAEVKRRYLKP